MKKKKLKGNLQFKKTNVSQLNFDGIKGGALPTNTFCPTNNKCEYTEFDCPFSIWICDQ